MTVLERHPTGLERHPTGTVALAADHLPAPRGPISRGVRDYLCGRTHVIPMRHGHGDFGDDDLQIGLWMLLVTQYAPFDGVPEDRALGPEANEVRQALTQSFLRHVEPRRPDGPDTDLRQRLQAAIGEPPPDLGSVQDLDPDRCIKRFVAKAPYVAWEADPHTLALARVERPLKQPLADIQAGEYGVGHERTHADIYRDCLAALGLDVHDALEAAPAAGYALANLAWIFGGSLRWRGAALGQLCLFEVDSVGPSRRAAEAWDRCGLPEGGRRWYDVHALADQEHASVIWDRLIPAIEAETPHLVPDVCMGVDATAAAFAAIADATG